jgi:hypothetical protein
MAASLVLAPSATFADGIGAPGASVSNDFPSYTASLTPPSLQAELARSGDGARIRPLETLSDPMAMSEGEKPKGSYLPVLYSLLMPGTGEIALGYPKRGIALIAVEVTSWIGYFYYHDQGLEGRAEFEAFADAHWDYDRWIVDHPANESLPPGMRTFETLDSIGQYAWPSSNWPGYHSWASKEEAELNYYENIGKYDWFISGWADWDPVGKPHDTSLRTQYRSLRQESNGDLDTAERFVYLSIATRVFSLVETVYLTKKARKDSGDAGNRSESKYSFTTRSTGITSGEVAFVYRF